MCFNHDNHVNTSTRRISLLCLDADKLFSIDIKNLNIYFVTSENPDKLQPYTTQSLYYRMIKTGSGILLGGMINRQRVVAFDEKKISEKQGILEAGLGYLNRNDIFIPVRVPLID